MPISKGLGAALIIVIVLVAGFSIYASFTYPRAVVSYPVSFTVGADAVRQQFEVPMWNDKVQVKVAVNSGVSLWNAKILNQSEVIWEHSKGQGEETTYASEWIALPTGSYNFTFGTIGAGSLEAEITVTSKGGFW